MDEKLTATTTHKSIIEEESPLFYVGWFLIFTLLPFGNTSLGSLLLLIEAFYLLIRKRKSWVLSKKAPSIVGMALFIGVMVLSNLFAVRKGLAFLSTLGFIFMLYTIFIGSQRLARREGFLYERLLPAFIVSGSISSLYTISTYLFGHLPRGRALFTAPNGAGTILLISLFLTIGFFFSPKCKMKRRHLLLLPIAVMIVALAFTFSRGAWLGTITAISFFLFSQRRSRILMLILLLIAGSLIYIYPAMNERFHRIFSITDNMDRIYIWKGAIKMIAANPLLGIGTGMFPFEYPEYRPPDDSEGNSAAFAHNIFLQVGAEFGILGLIIFSFILISILLPGLKNMGHKDPLYQSMIAAFLGILVHQMVDCTIYGLEIGGAFWLISGLIVHLPPSEESEPLQPLAESRNRTEKGFIF